VYGLHLPLCLAVCLPLRLDSVVAYVAANISNPLVAPFLITAEIELGSLILTGETVSFTLEHARRTGVSGFLLQAIVGSLVIGAALAALGAAGAFVTAARAVRGALPTAIQRTLRRYANAPRSERVYLSIKLATDPVLECLADQPGDFGRVIDAGAGRGQLGLALLELGKARSVCGFDWDERKVAIARAAAGDYAEFWHADLRDATWRPADTVLAIDVLHYLSEADQDAFLERAIARLAPGGRLFIRDVDGAPSWRSRLTALFERAGRRIGINRGRTLEFRPARAIAARLEAMGLEVTITPAATGTPFANVLIRARVPDGG
jgi:SAM-dependent methyltransferase